MSLDIDERIDFQIGRNIEFDRDAAELVVIGPSTDSARPNFEDVPDDANSVWLDQVNGDDLDPGTEAEPVQTLAQARTLQTGGKDTIIQVDNNDIEVGQTQETSIGNGLQKANGSIGTIKMGAGEKFFDWTEIPREAITVTTDESDGSVLYGSMIVGEFLAGNYFDRHFALGRARYWAQWTNTAADVQISPDGAGVGAAHDAPYSIFTYGIGGQFIGHVNNDASPAGTAISITPSYNASADVTSSNDYSAAHSFFGYTFLFGSKSNVYTDPIADRLTWGGTIFKTENLNASNGVIAAVDTLPLTEAKITFEDDFDETVRHWHVGAGTLGRRIFFYLMKNGGSRAVFVLYSDDLGETWIFKETEFKDVPASQRFRIWEEGTVRQSAYSEVPRNCIKSNGRDKFVAMLPVKSGDTAVSLSGTAWMTSDDGIEFTYRKDTTIANDNNRVTQAVCWLNETVYLFTCQSDDNDNNRLFQLSDDLTTIDSEITSYSAAQASGGLGTADGAVVQGVMRYGAHIGVIICDSTNSNRISVFRSLWSLNYAGPLCGYNVESDLVSVSTNLNCDFKGLAGPSGTSENTIFRGRLRRLGDTTRCLALKGVDSSWGDLTNVLIIGPMVYHAFGTTTIDDFINSDDLKDCIIDGAILTRRNQDFQSGNHRGFWESTVTKSTDVSALDPQYLDEENGDYRLSKQSDTGFDSDSPLVAASKFAEYTYLTVDYPADLGPYSFNNQLVTFSYDNDIAVRRPGDPGGEIEKIFRPVTFFEVTRNGTPYSKNRVEHLARGWRLTWGEVDESIFTLLELFLADRGLKIKANLFPQAGIDSSFLTTASASAGDFFITVSTATAIEQGSTLTIEGKKYIVMRTNDDGADRRVLLSKNLLDAVSNGATVLAQTTLGLKVYRVVMADELIAKLENTKSPGEYAGGITIELFEDNKTGD